MSKNPLIIFEGIEGSGKTLHLNNVVRYLKKKNIKFIKLREPGGTKNAEKIRKIILSNKSNFNEITDLLLYLASRSENVEKLIIKNYRKKIILIDRLDRKSTRLNSSHVVISYAVFCLKKKKIKKIKIK